VVVEVVFIADIFVNFFESYQDQRGMEVVDLSDVAKHYLCSYFLVDVLAAIPTALGQALISLFIESESGSQQAVEASRLMKLQRMQRLTRLMQLSRVARCIFTNRYSPFWKWVDKFRGIRIIKFLCGLAWVIHLMACGWYIVAALHSQPENTWVAKRSVNPMGDMLVDQPAIEQWLHSMYFVLTVFTTVGFGDMSAGTEAEIVYVALVMVVGAVVHSIVISEVITIVTSSDRLHDFKDSKFKVVEAFAAHTELQEDMVDDMKAQITYRAKYLMENNQDKGDMVHLITGKFFSRWFVGTLPDALFQGRIKANLFLTLAQEMTPSREFVPPSLVCLLAVHLNQFQYEAGEVVYQKLDYPFYLYLVLKGSFANVATASPTGGIDAGGSLGVAAGATGEQDMLTPSICGKANPKRRITMTAHEGIPQVYPYRAYSFNSYFGDFELLPGKQRPRKSTVRCETTQGNCLGLAKDAFHSIVDQFPQYASPWKWLGLRREFCRMQQSRRMHRGLPLKCFAARCIQIGWQNWRDWKRNHDMSAENPSAPHDANGIFSMAPVASMAGQAGNAAADIGTCSQNRPGCQDVNTFKKDIEELKDTMRLMVKEVASLSRTLQSMRNEPARSNTNRIDMM